MADDIHRLQVEVLCWCGRLASMNGRLMNGRLVTEGDQVVVADTVEADAFDVRYQVLCRRHWRSGEVGRQRPIQQRLPFG